MRLNWLYCYSDCKENGTDVDVNNFHVTLVVSFWASNFTRGLSVGK